MSMSFCALDFIKEVEKFYSISLIDTRKNKNQYRIGSTGGLYVFQKEGKWFLQDFSKKTRNTPLKFLRNYIGGELGLDYISFLKKHSISDNNKGSSYYPYALYKLMKDIERGIVNTFDIDTKNPVWAEFIHLFAIAANRALFVRILRGIFYLKKNKQDITYDNIFNLIGYAKNLRHKKMFHILLGALECVQYHFEDTEISADVNIIDNFYKKEKQKYNFTIRANLNFKSFTRGKAEALQLFKKNPEQFLFLDDLQVRLTYGERRIVKSQLLEELNIKVDKNVKNNLDAFFTELESVGIFAIKHPVTVDMRKKKIKEMWLEEVVEFYYSSEKGEEKW